ncbi:hypothetical protein BFJ70_g4022 [Fusarium oxysporum]|nr:hypothetical protein FOWG_10653 [Fusarium oxysporum f. sp. lycopersici MN25]KAJ4113832.1 hypothetical protein NW765_011439 [Fusarium oxysporum]KAJ4278843.1 hypothetical protein NW764_006201 [Fusarium oxysporum]RKL43707.1 hypothetical protein BFJ70_g4022 [Fusarium oxysporum]
MSAISIVKGSIKLAGLLFKPSSLSKALGVVVIYPTGGVKEQTASTVTDASAVADYLQRLDYVDANRIGIVGICAGGGYAVAAAKGDRRFKAVAVVSAASMGHGVRLGRSGDDNPAEKVAVLDQVAQSLQAEANGGEAVTVLIMSPTLAENPTKDA